MSSVEEIYKIIKIKYSRRLKLIAGLYVFFVWLFLYALTQSYAKNYYEYNFLAFFGMIALYLLNLKVFRDSLKEKAFSELKIWAKYLITAFVVFLVVSTSFFFFIMHTKSQVSLIVEDESRVHAKLDSENLSIQVDDDCLEMSYVWWGYQYHLGLFKNKIHIEYLGEDKIRINGDVFPLMTSTKADRPAACKTTGNTEVFRSSFRSNDP